MAIASSTWTGVTAEYAWLDDHLDHLSFVHKVGHQMEVSGIIRVEPDRAPGTTKEGLAYLMTKFLRLVDELTRHQVHLERLPEVVIGQVGNGYQAQVTLTIKMDTYVSPYTEASALGYDTPMMPKTITPKYTPMKWEWGDRVDEIA